MYKVVWICRFNENLSREQGQKHWREVHAPLVLEVPGIIGYTQNHCVDAVSMALPTGDALIIDGFAEAWWETEEAYEAAMVSPEWKTLNADAEINFDVATMVGATIEEYVMKPLPAGRT
jgi:uncharacterized protein (TIGR02118 family)